MNDDSQNTVKLSEMNDDSQNTYSKAELTEDDDQSSYIDIDDESEKNSDISIDNDGNSDSNSSSNIFNVDINDFLVSILNKKELIEVKLFNRMRKISKNKINHCSDVSFKLLDALPNINFNKFLSILFPDNNISYSWKHLKEFAFNNDLLKKYISMYMSQDIQEVDDSYPKFMDIFMDSIWTERYSPRNSSQVLSNKDKAQEIIDWLNNWKIDKIELPTVIEPEIPEETNKRGRKKKSVDPSYYPENDISMSYYDYSPVNYYNSLFGSQPVETNDDKFLYLIGPPASGKSSTIQACALECGFEVLEIYPGIKRSGKDIMNIIGDLTQSHTVSQMSEKILHSPKRKNSYTVSSPPQSSDIINIDENTNEINPESTIEKNEEKDSLTKKETPIKGN